MKLTRQYIEKPWGQTRLPPMFNSPSIGRIGEVWFTGAAQLPLLAKYIFTSEPLSIQVHPNDQQARARGQSGGKTECWYILDAQPEAVIGLGLNSETSSDQLRTAALDGSIERLIHWRPVTAGDFILVPPGTIHAIGAGITLLEFQQNADLTYRLFDYGRPRELHLDDGMSVASRSPFDERLVQRLSRGEQRMLVDGLAFRVASSVTDMFEDHLRWIMPIDGIVKSGDDLAEAGDCLVLEAGERLEANDSWMLIGTTS